MKLLINLSGNYVGGGLQVAISFLYESIKIHQIQYVVFLGENFNSQVDTTLFPENFSFIRIPKLKFYQYQSRLSKLEQKVRPDVVFSVFGPTYWRPKAPHVMGFAIGHYLYPESPFFHNITFKEKVILFLKRKIHLYYFKRDSDILIGETKDVQRRLENLFKNKDIRFVSNTCGTQFLGVTNDENYFDFIRNDRFKLLLLCKYYPHKNIEIIKDVVVEMRKRGLTDIQFVLTITPKEYDAIFGVEYIPEIITVGPVKAFECPQLYNVCNATFLPTLLECFTSNYPESMMMRKPILTSNLDFARSICQDAALYFDPMDPIDILNKIVLLKNTTTMQNMLVEKGLFRLKEFPTATERALKYINICKEREAYV